LEYYTALDIIQKKTIVSKKINQFEFELNYKHKSTEYYVSAIYLPVYVNNEINSFLIISEDITERKKHVLERQTMFDDLLIRNDKLKSFAFIVSHVLRAPVANILGLNALFTEDPESKDKYIELLNQSTQKLDKVIRELNEVLQDKNKKNLLIFIRRRN
jgi:signal transduction histidine kinase